MKTKKLTTLHLRKSISPECFRGCLLIPIALCCFALWQAPKAFGVTPAPDGAYPGANTAEGQNALQSLTSGIHNTALGYQTLFSNTTGHDNIATGFQALFSNTTGSNNTANGYEALTFNTTGNQNTANGYRALYSNTTGYDNAANGYLALYSNTTGLENTANGVQALYNNTTGNFNTANGLGALFYNTTGYENTANGLDALFSNTTGAGNIALGAGAGDALTTGSNNIDIGNGGVPGESNTIRIGNGGQSATFIAGIYGLSEGGTPAAVYINSNGQLGTMSSSRRFKKEIKPMDQTSQAILGLQPVTFQYKSDPTGTAQFGLIAEEVAKVDPDLVVRDGQGEIYSVRYEAVNAMLLNEFLKEHRTVQELKSTAAKQETTVTQQRKDFQSTIGKLEASIAQQQKDFQATAAHQQKQIETLTAGLQRVSAQVEMSRPAPQMALNNQ
jgi:Chaperone of endosialidase